MYNLLVIVTMWNKVNELSRQSYSQAQIAQLLGVHRDTVRRYQSMSEKEFNDHLVTYSGPRSASNSSLK